MGRFNGRHARDPSDPDSVSEPTDSSALAEMRAARAEQGLVEERRLQRHADIASAILAASPARQQEIIANAMARVQAWRREGTSSVDYVDRWEALLKLPPESLAKEIVGDLDGWGQALRQNSPF